MEMDRCTFVGDGAGGHYLGNENMSVKPVPARSHVSGDLTYRGIFTFNGSFVELFAKHLDPSRSKQRFCGRR